MVSEPSELNIVYTVIQCTVHHMGKSVTKTLHVITPLKDVYKRNVVKKVHIPLVILSAATPLIHMYYQCHDKV